MYTCQNATLLETTCRGLFVQRLTFVTFMDRLVDKKTLLESELTEEQRELSKNYLPELTDLEVTRKEVTNALRKTRLMVAITLLWIYG